MAWSRLDVKRNMSYGRHSIENVRKLAFEIHPIEGRYDVCRQRSAQRAVVHIRMQISQDRALGVDALDPLQRLFEIEMTRMRRAAQRIDAVGINGCKASVPELVA